MRFEGFGDGAVEFFEGLEADNSKAYWADNLALYREHVRGPMEALLAELEPEFAAGFGKGKVFRPHRDVRFSKDKSPYKTHCGAVVEQGRGGGAYYVEVSADGLLVAGGCFHTEPDQPPFSSLLRVRNCCWEPDSTRPSILESAKNPPLAQPSPPSHSCIWPFWCIRR